ncbi:MAG: VOC family protein [Gammaproteobacteria bacterium]
MATRRLTFLSAVTWCVADLDAARSAWCDHLGFRVVAEGEIGAAQCEAWNTPAARGQPYCLLEPASGDPVFVRFVQSGDNYAFGPPGHFGWCAAEFLVEDPDQLASRLADSPFTRLAGPADLFARPKAPRAMQMLGPSGEIVYFTRILPGGSQYGMKGAKSEVDRTFIVPVGGPSMTEMQRFYGELLGLRTMEPMAFINPIMAHACGVPPGTVFPTAIVPLPGRRFLIELDELPPDAVPRPRPDGCLPPGMAMVSFLTDDLDAVPVAFRSAPARLDLPPYDGARTAIVEGPSGEWCELIERA